MFWDGISSSIARNVTTLKSMKTIEKQVPSTESKRRYCEVHCWSNTKSELKARRNDWSRNCLLEIKNLLQYILYVQY